VVAAGDEVGLRVDLDNDALLAVVGDPGRDLALCRDAAGAGGRLDDPLLEDHFDSLLHVAVGLDERVLAVGHARLGAVTELFHHRCVDRCHDGCSFSARAIAAIIAASAAATDDFCLRAVSATPVVVITAVAGYRLFSGLRAFDDRVGDARRDELDRADRVVVSGDRVRDLVRVAVRVGDGDDREADLVRFLHGDELFGGIDDEHRAGERPHVLEAAEVLLEALVLLLEARDFFLRDRLVGPVFLHALEVAHALEAHLYGAEVRERAAEPAVDDEEARRARRLLADDLLGLALRADHQDVAAAADGVDDEAIGPREEPRGLV